jgi:hypothetical protein
MSTTMDRPPVPVQSSPLIIADDDHSFAGPPSPKSRSVTEAIESLSLRSEIHVRQDDRVDSLLSSQPSTPTRPHREPTRSNTEPAPSSPTMLAQPIAALPSPRSRSPYSRTHMRSRSTNTPTAPPMARANSLPTPVGMNQSHVSSPAGSRSQSPFRSAAPRARSPLRNSFDESGVPESINEDAELDLTPKQALDNSSLAAYQPSAGPLSFPRRRRPSSPLHQVLSASEVSTSQPSTPNQPHDSPVMAAGLSSSPQKDPARFNEAFPQPFVPYASSVSSISSTPSSIRSRSPSISSLETIPDSPDAEQAAVEEDEVLTQRKIRGRQRNNSDSGSGSTDGDSLRRSSLDVPERGRTNVIAGGRKGDQKKRWSVCGHERWGDRDLETIWED